MRTAFLTSGLLLTPLAMPVAASQLVPLTMPPPPPTEQPLPQLQPGRSCPALQTALRSNVGSEARVWSVTVLNSDGDVLGTINGAVPRIPASNQKLISTAYALDRLGPDFRLKTRLIQRPDGSMELNGQGDPDLGIAGLQRFVLAALRQGGARGNSVAGVKLMVREEPRSNWWPSDWHPADRGYAYGAPITRLALTSNAVGGAVSDPYSRLQRLFQQEALRRGGTVQIQRGQPVAETLSAVLQNTVVLHEESSAPMHALLSLANTESHNFTAEVLMRQASGLWDVRAASRATERWMFEQGLPVQGLRVADGSGLSRNNRVTSNTIAALLMRMDQHPFAAYYQASMAIAGQRGTLRNLYRGSVLDGRFRGKTGTISGVRSISGYLQTVDGPRYVSMISNGSVRPNTVMGQILRSVKRFSPCPSSVAPVKRPDVLG
ncbi:penicillin-binding-like protein Pbp4 [Synechococcus sp. MIT S9220]|uniref:D-alanyl-D-alanine carboxypeptidase/D-alanyl-D-alanine-endopeptidase n=1 Tax=unclassified Synechococcus TaxID=2626047 RepID=UPI00164AB189|nr:D-alanyl-D-alanine carboxypeptidase [Synechococcus sp. MIT S9220]NOL47016.1 D-alanyl-D-alanine carboxypeptidase [Synechococcus sp. MIT S9220]QNJ22719.1 penicillin-binding-like protein Pbp4 [Synechococcus sp. MIT S9220]